MKRLNILLLVALVIFNVGFIVSHSPNNDEDGFGHWLLIWFCLNAGAVAIWGICVWASRLSSAVIASGEAARQQLKK